jgi:hypothetical protein
VSELVEIGLEVGDVVRFRKLTGSRWIEAVVTGRERDGSVAVRDPAGRSRSLRIDRLEVRGRSRRGAELWEPLADRAARTEQLKLL